MLFLLFFLFHCMTNLDKKKSTLFIKRDRTPNKSTQVAVVKENQQNKCEKNSTTVFFFYLIKIK